MSDMCDCVRRRCAAAGAPCVLCGERDAPNSTIGAAAPDTGMLDSAVAPVIPRLGARLFAVVDKSDAAAFSSSVKVPPDEAAAAVASPGATTAYM